MTDLDRLRRRSRAMADLPVPEAVVPAILAHAAGPADRWAIGPLDASASGHRVGLVLAGGAAKGAYEVGVLDHLAELGITVSAIAGTSIGALNGAVLASAPTVAAGVRRLASIWERFADRFGPPPFGEDGLRIGPDGALEEKSKIQLANLVPRLRTLTRERSLLEDLVQESVRPDRIREGRPFWVGAYPVIGADNLRHPIRHAIEFVRWFARDRGHMLRLNDMPDDQIHQAILASAALPFIFPSRDVNGRQYRDGWLGRDNTPVRALAHDEHCTYVIVVHLKQGELLRKEEHPGLTLINIRPSRPLQPEGPLGPASALLDFSPQRIRQLRVLGYRDAQRHMGRMRRLLGVTHDLRGSGLMLDAVAELDEPL